MTLGCSAVMTLESSVVMTSKVSSKTADVPLSTTEVPPNTSEV